MPKTKPTKGRKPGICATSLLHLSGEDGTRKLLHSSKIKGVHVKELLLKAGKKCDRFSGKICFECLRSVSLDYDKYMSIPSETHQQGHLDFLSMSSENLSDVHTSDQDDVSSLMPTFESDQDVNPEPVIILSMNNLRRDLQALTSETRALIAYELGVIERPSIKVDTASLTKLDHRDLNSLSSVCNQQYLRSRNNVLVHFLGGLWNGGNEHTTDSTLAPSGFLPFPIRTPKDIYKIAKVTEACMGLTMHINILPFHFRELVLLYSLTRSRTALTLMSSTAPHGSYQSVRSWLDRLAMDHGEVKLPSEKGDVLAVFDNNQVMQRRWNISVDNRSICSVITMVMFMDIDPEGDLQFREELKPSHWMWNDMGPEKLAALKNGQRNITLETGKYRKHFHPWLTDILQQVVDEQTEIGGKYIDDVDKKVASDTHAKDFKTCSECGFTDVPRRLRICPTCNKRMSSIKAKSAEQVAQEDKGKSKEGEIRCVINQRNETTFDFKYERSTKKTTDYDHLPQHHPKVPPNITVGEPIFLNPCSYEAVAEVFRMIGKQAGIRKYGGRREWLSLVCDGLPYVMGYQLIERTFICDVCSSSLHGQAQCNSHAAQHGHNCQFNKEFDWIVLQPGPGHIEMNMIKTFVKFSWSIFWERMVEVFNFRSEIAKKSARSVSDHHKGMTLAKIARESFAKELVLPYVRKQLSQTDSDISVAGFIKFTMKTVKSPSYALMCDLIFLILDSIFEYRAGLRSGDVQMMESGRSNFSRMWSSRCHPLYRQLAAYDTIMTVCMPPPILNFMNKTKSFNLSSTAYTGEGADFKLEEVNRNVQHWLPSGPTDKDWRNACANQQKLTKLRKQALNEMDLKHSSKSIESEVMSFRSCIRQSSFLSDHDEGKPLTSITNQPLDHDLPDFASKAANKEAIFMTNFLEHKDKGSFSEKRTVQFNEPPIFVTPQERADYNDIQNKTVRDIIQLIKVKISQIEDQHMRRNFSEAFTLEVLSKKGKVKKDYVDFYELIVEFENSVSNQDADSDDDSDI